MGGIVSLLAFFATIGIWIICLIQILQGNALETFQLGTVVTSRTALGATFLEVFIGDSIIFLVMFGAGFAYYLRHREEQDFLAKYAFLSRDRRIAWRRKRFPKKASRRDG